MGMIDIIAGSTNELPGLNDDLYEKRIAICKVCPLGEEISPGKIVCNSRLWINENGDVSNTAKVGYVRGCSCAMDRKARITSSRCIINKW